MKINLSEVKLSEPIMIQGKNFTSTIIAKNHGMKIEYDLDTEVLWITYKNTKKIFKGSFQGTAIIEDETDDFKDALPIKTTAKAAQKVAAHKIITAYQGE